MRAEVINRLETIPCGQWNRVAGTSNPFLRHEFLSALERHNCVGEVFGWYPQHIAVFDDAGALAGAVPLYLKDNSYGEFVFDWSWADAYHRAGKSYYPKLVSAIPYTPVTGPRLLVRDDVDRTRVRDMLIDTARALAAQIRCSSLHWLFTDSEDTETLLRHGLMRRTGCHFHWHDDGYRSFEDFLSRLSSRKRKKIRRERRYVEEAGIRMEIVHGHEASEAQWLIMHDFYRSTFEKKSGMPTLSLEFFLEISRSMGRQVVLVFAWLGRKAIAGAINLRSDTALYGRHWGCTEQYHSLHFETCYYQGIDYCIAHGLKRFEPGTQGEHKIARGFVPEEVWSAHWLSDPRFAQAIDRYLDREREHVDHYIDVVNDHVPYRRESL